MHAHSSAGWQGCGIAYLSGGVGGAVNKTAVVIRITRRGGISENTFIRHKCGLVAQSSAAALARGGVSIRLRGGVGA